MSYKVNYPINPCNSCPKCMGEIREDLCREKCQKLTEYLYELDWCKRYDRGEIPRISRKKMAKPAYRNSFTKVD